MLEDGTPVGFQCRVQGLGASLHVVGVGDLGAAAADVDGLALAADVLGAAAAVAVAVVAVVVVVAAAVPAAVVAAVGAAVECDMTGG